MNLLEGIIDERSRAVIRSFFEGTTICCAILTAIIIFITFVNNKTESKFQNLCINTWIAFVESPFKDLPVFLVKNIFIAKKKIAFRLMFFFQNPIMITAFYVFTPILVGLGFGYFFSIYHGITSCLFSCLILLLKVGKPFLQLIGILSLVTSTIAFFYLWMKCFTTFNVFFSLFICFILLPFASMLYLGLHQAGITRMLNVLIGCMGILLIRLFTRVILNPLSSLIVRIKRLISSNDACKINTLSSSAKLYSELSRGFISSMKSVYLFFYSKSRGYPFIVTPEDDQDAIHEKMYSHSFVFNLIPESVISLFTTATIFPLSMALTTSALALGYYVEPSIVLTVSVRLLIVNFVFDLLTVYTTVSLLAWLLSNYSLNRTLLIIVLDLSLSAVFGCISLYLIFYGTQDKLNFFEITNILFGKSLDGSVYILGSYFWLMHTTFIPTAIIIFLLLLTYLAHLLHFPFEKIAYGIGTWKKPLHFCALLSAVVGSICTGIGWLV